MKFNIGSPCTTQIHQYIEKAHEKFQIFSFYFCLVTIFHESTYCQMSLDFRVCCVTSN